MRSHPRRKCFPSPSRGFTWQMADGVRWALPPARYYSATASLFAGMALTWMLDRIIHYLYSRQGAPSTNEIMNKTFDRIAVQGGHHAAKGRYELEGGDLYADRDSGAVGLDSEANDPDLAMSVLQPDGNTSAAPSTLEGREAERQRRSLISMAFVTSIGILLHNFPEGLATFVATAHDPSVGAPIAFAIAAHNVPEGVCVAVPIFLATGNRWRGFFIGVASGLAEPLAGGIGWAILGSDATEVSELTFALLFGLVSGMMIFVSFREILPTARGYDPQDKVSSLCLFGGMLVMAASLMLFKI